jgi:stage V sporulation protein B
MTLKKTLIKGGMWVAVSSVFVALFGYLFRFLLIKNLTLEEYGLYYAIVSVFLFATCFIDIGRHVASLKYASEAFAKNNKKLFKSIIHSYFKFKFKTGLIFILVVLLSAGFLASNYFRSASAFLPFIALGIIYTMADIFFGYILTLLKVVQDQKKYALLEIFKFSFQIILLIVFLSLGFRIWAPILAIFLAPLIITSIYYFIFYKNYFPDFFNIKIENLKKINNMIKVFAFTNLFFELGTYILSYTDTFMLTYFTDLAQVGLYNIAVPTARLILFFSLSITLLLIGLTSSMYVKKQFSALNNLINIIYKISLFGFLPIALIMFSFPELIITLLYSAEYVVASTALQILSINSIFILFFAINTSILNGIGKPKVNLYLVLIGGIFNVLLNFFLIPRFGINGAAFSTLLGYILMAFLSFIFLKKNFTQLSIKISYFLKYILISIIFVFLINYLKGMIFINDVWIKSIVILLISCTIFILLTFILRVIKIRDIKDILKLLVKGDKDGN